MGSAPEYIFKIAPPIPDVPSELPEALPVSDLDKSSGFIHMSTAAQIPNTLKMFFATSASSKDAVYLLRVPYAPLEQAGKIRWEDPKAEVCGPRQGEGMFPHIYENDLRLGKNEIESVRYVESGLAEDGWTQQLAELENEGWLVG